MYRRVVLKLDNVISEPKEIVSRDQRIVEVFIAKMPATTTIGLHFGETADAINIDAPLSFLPSGEEGQRGLFFTNPVAQAGVTIEVYVVTGRGASLNTELERV